jgi:DNA invertase Pin-like site-specific DNA recombinase
MKRAVLYLRVSTIEQTTANHERELRQIADRMRCEIVKVYKDHGIRGATGRDKRPAFDAMCQGAAWREFDLVMAWNVDRLGRSLQDLVGFLSELHALKIDLYLHRQGIDTTTPGGKAIGVHFRPCFWRDHFFLAQRGAPRRHQILSHHPPATHATNAPRLGCRPPGG